MTTYDTQAISVLLSNESKAAKQTQLQALLSHAEGVRECPECGTTTVHEDNGCVGLDKSWCCIECGCHFDEA